MACAWPGPQQLLGGGSDLLHKPQKQQLKKPNLRNAARLTPSSPGPISLFHLESFICRSGHRGPPGCGFRVLLLRSLSAPFAGPKDSQESGQRVQHPARLLLPPSSLLLPVGQPVPFNLWFPQLDAGPARLWGCRLPQVAPLLRFSPTKQCQWCLRLLPRARLDDRCPVPAPPGHAPRPALGERAAD